jgi:hypothetical protein
MNLFWHIRMDKLTQGNAFVLKPWYSNKFTLLLASLAYILIRNRTSFITWKARSTQKHTPLTSSIQMAGKYFTHYTVRSCMACAPHQMLSGRPNQEERGRWACGTLRGRRETDTGLGGKTWGERPFGRPRRRWEDKIRMDLKKNSVGRAWKRQIWLLRIRTGAGPCVHGNEPLGSIKSGELLGYSEELLAFHEGLSSTALVVYLKYLFTTDSFQQGTSLGADSRPLSRNSTSVVKI